MPHRVIYGSTEFEAMQNLARLGFYERRDRNVDYDMEFTNEVFETE